MARRVRYHSTYLARASVRFPRDSDGNVRDPEGTYLQIDSSDGGRGQLREGPLRHADEEAILIGRQVDYHGNMAEEIPTYGS